jgi:predicted acyl esterase
VLGKRKIVAVALALACLVLACGPTAGRARADGLVMQDYRVAMPDGVELLARLGGEGPLVDGHLPPRPLIVELSPYGPACCPVFAGPAYNYLQVHLRGTGESDGAFDALGDATQRDVASVLAWACAQPWSNGRIGLYGFSASAIVVYNSLHLDLPCVDTAVLGAGTHELYRDLMYPGGVPNQVPALGVLALIGAPSLAAGPDRLGRAPLSSLDTIGGMFDTGISYLQHPTLDAWWRERGMRGDVNDLPILMVTGFYDVESRGPFQAFQELRGDGAHLMVVGAHDGVPVGSGGSDATRQRWFDRYLRDLPTGVEDDPVVQLWMSDGDREDMLAGAFVRASGPDWPLPGTRWAALALDGRRSGTASSLNDGTLTLDDPGPSTLQAYPTVPSLPTATDPHTTSLLGIFNGSPTLTDLTVVEPLGLSFTTPPLASDVEAAGPASVELPLTSTAPETDLYVVLSDVWPDGTAHPVATGRLKTAYPHVDLARSLRDEQGQVVQPYGRFDVRDPAAVGTERRYQVELWPVGNRFRAGHRLRLHVLGASAFSTPGLPAVNTVRVGGEDGARLLLPVLGGDDLAAALGAAAAPGEPSTPSGPSEPAVTEGGGRGADRLPATGGSAPLAVAAGAVLAAALLRRLGRAATARPAPPRRPSSSTAGAPPARSR